MTQLFLSDSEIRNTNDWLKKKDQSLTKGTVRMPIWSLFSLMNGLNCNWIAAATKREFLLELRSCFEEQFRGCRGMRNIESVGRILIDRGQRVKKINFSLFLCSD